MPLHVIIVTVTLVYKHPGTLINQLTEFLESIESSVVWTRHVYINHHSCFLFITFWYQIFLSIFVVWHSDKPIYLEHDMQHKDKAYYILQERWRRKGYFWRKQVFVKKNENGQFWWSKLIVTLHYLKYLPFNRAIRVFLDWI